MHARANEPSITALNGAGASARRQSCSSIPAHFAAIHRASEASTATQHGPDSIVNSAKIEGRCAYVFASASRVCTERYRGSNDAPLKSDPSRSPSGVRVMGAR